MISTSVIYVAVPVSVSVVVAIGLFRHWRSRTWGKCVSNTNLRGKTYVITGGTSGLGLETARALVKRKARVIITYREINKARDAVNAIRRDTPTSGELIPMYLDLSDFKSIENFSNLVHNGFNKIDCLINNAGVYVPLKLDAKTNEGFEIHMGVNHLGHFYLTTLLLDLLKKATPSRIVIVTSSLHEKGVINFDDLNLRRDIALAVEGKIKSRHNPGYCNSKLMNVYFARSLADKFKNSGIDVNSCCPGFCYTNLFRHSVKWYHYLLFAPMMFFIMRTAKQGSQTILLCASDPSMEGKTGKIYRDCKVYESKYPFTKDEEEALWKASEEMVTLRKPLPDSWKIEN